MAGVDTPCEKFDAILKGSLGDDDTVALIYAACFVVLTGMQAKVFIEISGGSDTGKSVVVACLEATVFRGRPWNGEGVRPFDFQTAVHERIRTFKS